MECKLANTLVATTLLSGLNVTIWNVDIIKEVKSNKEIFGFNILYGM